MPFLRPRGVTAGPASFPRPLARLLSAAVACAAVTAVLLPVDSPAEAAGASGCDLPRSAAWERVATSRTAYPKVVLGPADLRRARDIEAESASAPTTSGMRVRQQLRFADAALTEPLPDGRTLSLSARASVERMLRLRVAMEIAADGTSPALAAGARTTPSAVYARRIRQEVAAWVRLPDWGAVAPLETKKDSMLEAAEVASAVAVGYSLAGHTMTASERATTRAALLSKALEPACWGYRNGSWMTDSTHNWGVVVNAGIAMAAVVTADDDPRRAAAVLRQAVPRAARSMTASARDGGSYEGPSYASLVHRYTTYLASTLELSFGETGLGMLPRLHGAARYLVEMRGPSGQLFAYSDSNTGRVVPWLPLWNARHGGDPLGDWLAAQHLATGHPDVLLFLWSRPTDATPEGGARTAETFPVSGAAVMRTDWSPAATWVGVKGGSNASNHSHLDLGTFVMDAGGQRFVGDYGQDSYSLPGYVSGPDRFSYWRRGSAGHSTLTRAGANQPTDASAALSHPVNLTGGARQVQVDMTRALQASSAVRRVTLDGRQVVVQDVARFGGPTTLRWSVQTQAAVRLSSDRTVALMTIGSQRVEARLSTGGPGRFSVTAAPRAPSGGLSNAGWSVLTVDVPTARTGSVHQAAVTVVLRPQGA